MAKRFRDAKTGDHIAYREGKDLTGTVRYASLNTQLGVEQSRRDDLESLGFVLVYFLRGRLPWQSLQAKNKQEKYDAIRNTKKMTTIEVLCQGHAEEFAIYLNACRKLGFDEKPDYSMLRKLFRDLFAKKGFEYDFLYDWLVQRPSKQVENKAAENKIEDNKDAREEGTQKKEEVKGTKKTAQEENKGAAQDGKKPAGKLLVHRNPVKIVKELARIPTGTTNKLGTTSNGTKSTMTGPKIATINPKVFPQSSI